MHKRIFLTTGGGATFLQKQTVAVECAFRFQSKILFRFTVTVQADIDHYILAMMFWTNVISDRVFFAVDIGNNAINKGSL